MTTVTVEVSFSKVRPDVFRRAVENARTHRYGKANLHLYDATEYAAMNCFLAPNQRAGVAVKADGDIVNVFSLPGARYGIAAVEWAKQNGGVKLDCFDGFLTFFYGQLGFKEYARVANWTPGEPDVVYMRLGD